MDERPADSEFVHALLAGNSELALSLARRHLSERGLASLYEDVVTPALREVGALWERNLIEVVDEHLATSVAQSVIATLYADRRQPAGVVPAVVACVGGEHHDLGARMLADLLELDGWRVLALGGDASDEALTAACGQTVPSLVALSATLPTRRQALVRAIGTVRQCAPQARILLGGRALAQCIDGASEYGVDAVAMSAREGVATAAPWRREPVPADRRARSRIPGDASTPGASAAAPAVLDLEAILGDRAPVAALVVDRGLVSAANHAAEALLGRNPTGERAATVVDTASRNKLDAALADTAPRIWELHIAPVEEAPVPIGFLVLPLLGGARLLMVASGATAESRTAERLLALHDRLSDLGRELARRSFDADTANARLEEERRFAAAVFETAPAAIVVADADGKILRCNPACEHATGLPTARLRGQRLWDLATLTAGGREALKLGFRATRLDPAHAVPTIETVFAERADRPRRIAWTIAAHPGAVGPERFVVCVGLDFTERSQLEVDLLVRRRSEEAATFLSDTSRLLATSIDYEITLERVAELAVPSLADVCLVDVLEEDGALRRVGAAHRDAARAALVRELAGRWALEEKRSRLAMRTGRAQLGELEDEELRATVHDPQDVAQLRALGFRFFMTLPLEIHGRRLGAISLARGGSPFDRDELLVGEDLARRLAMAIDNARFYRETQRAVRAREDLLAIVSHDLRNPLGSILMRAELVARYAPPGESGELARVNAAHIRRAAASMQHLIGDLLRAAQIEGGLLPLARARQPVAPLVDEAVHLMLPHANERSQRLERRVAEGLPCVDCDKERIIEVFSNLIGNAVKNTPEGGTIEVVAESQGDSVLFAVRDTGHGIADDVLSHLFDRHWQQQRIRRAGVGLGLFIVHGIVTGHGGRVWVESHLGSGSTFFFTLPAKP